MEQKEARVVTNTIKWLFEALGVNVDGDLPMDVVYDLIESNYINGAAESVDEFVKEVVSNPKKA